MRDEYLEFFFLVLTPQVLGDLLAQFAGNLETQAKALWAWANKFDLTDLVTMALLGPVFQIIALFWGDGEVRA